MKALEGGERRGGRKRKEEDGEEEGEEKKGSRRKKREEEGQKQTKKTKIRVKVPQYTQIAILTKHHDLIHLFMQQQAGLGRGTKIEVNKTLTHPPKKKKKKNVIGL